MSELAAVTKEKLIADLKVVIADTEELLKITASDASEKMAGVRLKLQEHLSNAKLNLAEVQGSALERAKAVGRATDDYVHENPWRSIGIAAGIGLVVGLLIGRR